MASVAAAALVSGAWGASAKTDLSTRAGVVRYLVLHGIDSTGVVIQRGNRNYAGPSCPGKGWTCSHAARVVQISNSDNMYQCTPSSGGLVAAPDTCTIVQISTGGSNNARCVETSSQAVVAQACKIQQQNKTGDNNAFSSQSVDVGPGHDEPPSADEASDGLEPGGDVRQLSAVLDLSTETASQTAELHQVNGSGSNASEVVQTIHQRTNTLDPSGAQAQDGHQNLVATQVSDTGDNSSSVHQSLAQKADATGVAAVTQSQNAQNLGPNTNADIRQTSTLGVNVSHLNQKNQLTMRSEKIATVTQTQGSSGGGLNGHVDESSPGLSRSFATQAEQQKMNADSLATSLTQNQFGPLFCCSTQQLNPNDVFRITQRSSQQANDGAQQTNAGVGNCDTSGTCSTTQSIQQQGGTPTTNSCTGQNCHTGIVCDPEGGCRPCSGHGCPSAPGSTFRLTVVVAGGDSNDDYVTSHPGTISCGTETRTTCANSYPAGTPVVLTASDPCDFRSWSGNGAATGVMFTVLMNSDETVTANYATC
jgi:hypothetical protein